eukprot:scaffold65777_cov53-Phaeocystis_antarctica.AAC.2
MPLAPRPPHALPPPGPASRPTSYALLSTRQVGGDGPFNQPLSFDTSSVTNMQAMLWVRSARTLGPQS